MPYGEVSQQREVLEERRRGVIGELDDILQDGQHPLRTEPLEKRLAVLNAALWCLDGRECEACGGEGGAHVHECPTQPRPGCGCC